MKLVIATGNEHKKEEIKEILDSSFELSTMKEEGIDIEIIEDGNSFEENALIKARSIKNITNATVIADDSGLEVDALNGQPGIYSARFAGEDVTYKDNNDKLLKVMKDIPEKERTAKFVCVVAIIFPDGEEITVRGECDGIIANDYQGENGFGYDPLFIVQGMDKTYAELTSEEKNKISHRGKALMKLQRVLKEKCNKVENKNL